MKADLAKLQLRSREHARGIFVLAATKLEPRLLETLESPALALFRYFFPPHKQLTAQQAQQLAHILGVKDDELITEAEAALAGQVTDYQPPATAAGPALIYPVIYWRDPSPSPHQRDHLRWQRLVSVIPLKAEAARLGIRPSALAEMERGCRPNEGLTTTPRARPLRYALQLWRRRWHLPEWVLNWALYRLCTWPPTDPLDYPLDPFGTNPPRPHLPGWNFPIDTWEKYHDIIQEPLEIYRKEIEALYRDEIKVFSKGEAAKRNPTEKHAPLGGPRSAFLLGGPWAGRS